MKSYKVLVLTDHSNHSKENSLYPFLVEMIDHPLCSHVDVASRGLEENSAFFKASSDFLSASSVDHDFKFSEDGHYLSRELKKVDPNEYDWIWLRLPPPLGVELLDILERKIKNTVVFNNPRGIFESGTKAFLMNFQSLCPPMRLCKSKDDIEKFSLEHPIVLKPYRDYGGRGIVKIENNMAFVGKEAQPLEAFLSRLDPKVEYLGVKFLKNVTEGDKRVVVVDGKILGASLRLPADGSWICNVAMGGSAHLSEVSLEEEKMVSVIDPILSKMGIVMYGLDTLVADDGRRVLSEINTTSIGGLPQIARAQGKDLVGEAIDLFWQRFIND